MTEQKVQKKVLGTYGAGSNHWVGDGFPVRNLFPSNGLEAEVNPFLMLDYAGPSLFKPLGKTPGVGQHPHRGFETVTIAYQGSVAHRDSAGNGGVIRPGEVQWMTAGGGILHNEFHEESFAKAGGIMHMIQIWVNLPRRDKLTAPKYQGLTNRAIPEVSIDGGKGLVRAISGSFGDAKGAASTFTPAHMLDLRLKPGAKVRLPTPKDYNTALLVLQGEVKANKAKAAAGEFIVFKNDGAEVNVEGVGDSIELFL